MWFIHGRRDLLRHTHNVCIKKGRYRIQYLSLIRWPDGYRLIIAKVFLILLLFCEWTQSQIVSIDNKRRRYRWKLIYKKISWCQIVFKFMGEERYNMERYNFFFDLFISVENVFINSQKIVFFFLFLLKQICKFWGKAACVIYIIASRKIRA